DGKTLATGCADGSLWLCDVVTWERRPCPGWHKGPVAGVAFAPDGKRLVTAGEADRSVVWRDPATGVPLTGPPVTPNCPVLAVAFDRKGKFLALGTRGKEVGEGRLWEVATGEERDPFKGDKHDISAVAFAPDGKTLAGVNGQQVWLWDLDGTKKDRVHPLPHAHPVRSI